MSIYKGTTLIAGVGNSVHNIGEIVPSILPLTDAGLHLLDGSLLSGTGVYADFVTYVAGLVSSYPDLFETEANWQTAVTAYGVCGKFVYDSVNNTVRLPKITGIIEGTVDVTALGDLVEAGLPNISGWFFPSGPTEWASFSNNSNHGGALTTVYSGGNAKNIASTSGSYPSYAIKLDASLSNSKYGNSATVQPQTIKAYYYIVIANSTKTAIQADIDQIATDLNLKAGTDLSNLTDAGNIVAAKASMPSTTYDNLAFGASGTEYNTPSDGWWYLDIAIDSSLRYVIMTNTTRYYSVSSCPSGTNNAVILMPACKGDTIRINFNTTGAVTTFRFFYAVGSVSEAS